MTFLRYGPNDDHVQYVEAEIEEEFGKQDQASVFVRRSVLPESEVERGQTEMLLVPDTSTADADADFGGVLQDINREGSTTEFIVESFERYAKDAEPTRGDQRYEAADDSLIVNDAISAVSQLSAGTVSTLDTSLTMVFSHASQAKKIRECETSTGGEVKYRPDKTVDYVDSLGSDKTTTTLSPAEQNITGDFNAEKKGGDEDVTHLRVIGAGEGQAQVTGHLIPQDDPLDYEGADDYQNVTRYSASHWSQGDRKEWDVRTNKDHTAVDALTSTGQAYIDDVQESHIEAFASIQSRTGVEVNLGDEFTVQYPEEEIDTTARVIKVTTKIDSTGYTYEADLSTRRVSVEDSGSEERQDLQRYNMAFEGTNVTMTTGGGRQPVNASNNYEFSFYYPAEVNYEHRVQLFIKGFNYRAYSSGALAGGEHTHSVEVTHPSHAHEISSTEFAHTHDLSLGSVNTEFHGHTDGTMAADDHDHPPGTMVADDHDHPPGTMVADSHGHQPGLMVADDHEHAPGTMAADDHDHELNESIEASSRPSRQAVASESGLNVVSGITSTNGNWTDRKDIDLSGVTYEEGFVHIYVTNADNVLLVRCQEEFTTNRFPGDDGVAIAEDGVSGGTTIHIPNDVGDVEIQTKQPNGLDVNGNLAAAWVFYEPHIHNVRFDLSSYFTELEQTAVVNNTDLNNANVSNSTAEEEPNVSNNTDVESANVSNNTAQEGANVTGETDSENPGVSGTSDTRGGLRTSDNRLGTTESTTTPPEEGGHEHDPEAGIIEFTEYASNCDVLVNGTSVGTSFGDGNGQFEEQVDISGLLSPGQVNTIEITSDTLGHIMAHLDIDVYRQILGNG
jgi:hypothetical protein